MCTSSGSYTATAAPKAVPGTTSVATGSTEDSLLTVSKVMANQRKRRGAASTVRNTGGASGISSSSESSGKTTFGE